MWPVWPNPPWMTWPLSMTPDPSNHPPWLYKWPMTFLTWITHMTWPAIHITINTFSFMAEKARLTGWLTDLVWVVNSRWMWLCVRYLCVPWRAISLIWCNWLQRCSQIKTKAPEPKPKMIWYSQAQIVGDSHLFNEYHNLYNMSGDWLKKCN